MFFLPRVANLEIDAFKLIFVDSHIYKRLFAENRFFLVSKKIYFLKTLKTTSIKKDINTLNYGIDDLIYYYFINVNINW
jgi:hypothetical protein